MSFPTDEQLSAKRIEVAKEKAAKLVCYGYEAHIDGPVSTEVKLTENFIFCYSTVNLITSKGMKRYGMATFSFLGIDTYYQNSNVIDKDKDYTISDVIKHTKNFFSYISKELEEVN